MDADAKIDVKRAERKLSILDIIATAFLGLVGIGLISSGEFTAFILGEMSRHSGYNSGTILFMHSISVAGVILLASSIWKVFSRGKVTRQ